MGISWKLALAASVIGVTFSAPLFGQTAGSSIWAPVFGVAQVDADTAPVDAPPPIENPFSDEAAPIEPVPLEPEALESEPVGGVPKPCEACAKTKSTCGPCAKAKSACGPFGSKCGGLGGFGTGWELPCVEGDPWKFWSAVAPCAEDCYGIDVGGWVQAGAYNYNTGMFNNYPNNLNVNQVWLYAEKALDTSCGFDWGFRVDGVYGTDGPDTQAFGNPPDSWDIGWDYGNFYGTAIPQLYGEVGFNNLSIKVGHFYTICGYEVVPATGNFFYSHAFTMYHAEPFTHTGALATYQAGDNLTVYGGWTKGWDTGFDTFGGDVFLGGVSVGVGEHITATYTTTFGNIGFGSDHSGYSHSIVIDTVLTDKLNYVFQSDYVDFRGTGAATSLKYGINNYLFYTINDCLAVGARLEWLNVEQAGAARIARSDLYEITVGLNYKPIQNLIIRPELRWDKDDDGFTVAPARADTLGIGMDIIMTF